MSRTTNRELIQTIRILKKKSNETGVNIWSSVAEKLRKSKHRRYSVNLSRINRYTKVGEVVVVPGKVLGAGFLDHKISIAAFSFSAEARRKIESVKGQCLTIPKLVEKSPNGSGVKIIG